MKISEGEYLMQDFIKKAKEDNDPFLIVHFSREQDRFNGIHEGLDKMDAQIIIKQLIRFFEFDELDKQVLTA